MAAAGVIVVIVISRIETLYHSPTKKVYHWPEVDDRQLLLNAAVTGISASDVKSSSQTITDSVGCRLHAAAVPILCTK